MNQIFLLIALVSVAWGIVSTIAIANFLQKEGRKINFIFINVLIFKYVHEYFQITTKENGKSGFWYYSFIISMNTALAFAIIGLILNMV
jgi:hypothetical protein